MANPGDAGWGDVNAGLAQAEVKVEETYTTPIHHHNPMETHAAMAQWDGDKLTLHDTTQSVTNRRSYVAKMFGIPEENVRVIVLFVGRRLWLQRPDVGACRAGRIGG